MKLLLDTHAYIWSVSAPERLSPRAAAALRSQANLVYLSGASAWELAIKFRKGKLPGYESIIHDYESHAEILRAEILPISHKHSLKAGLLDWEHRDPFDRMLAAQAQHEEMALVSRDPAFGTIDVNVVW